MRTLLDDVMVQIKKTIYPFQKESNFTYWTDNIITDKGKTLHEYTIKFPVAGSLLKDMPFYTDAGIIIVEFPEWLELDKRSFEYHDKRSKYESMLTAIQLIVETEMELM